MTDKGNVDLIQSLVSTPFKTRSETDKKKILKAMRPLPSLKSEDSCRGDGCNKNPPFEMVWYGTYKWLAGSTTNNGLYCWPCLLLSDSNKKGIWTKKGFFDFRILHSVAESHGQSKDHIKNSRELDEIDPFTLSVNPKKSCKTKGNTYYKNNRLLLQRLIKVTTLLCKQGLAIYLVRKDTTDGAKFKHMFDLVIAEEKQLKQHCEQLGSIYTNMFSSILQDVIETISHEILHYQKTEFNKAPFFSVQVDNALDVSGELLHTVIVRYVNGKGELKEHLVGFPVACDKRDRQFATGLFRTIEDVLGFNLFKEKMISYSLCGSSIQVKELESLKKEIRTKAPDAILIHSVAHRHKVVLQQGVTFVTETLSFFAILESVLNGFKVMELGDFFLVNVLNQERIPSHTSELHWSLNSMVMTFLINDREKLMDSYAVTCNDPSSASSRILEADKYLKNFEDREFVFLLYIFQRIFNITDEFFDILQNHSSDVTACHNSLMNTLQKLDQLKKSNECKNIFIQASKKTGKPIVPSTMSDMTTIYAGLKLFSLFQNIIINIIDQLNIRFAELKNLEFLQLTNSKKFVTYKSKFPNEALASLQSAYGQHFNIDQLKDELTIFIYPDSQFNLSAPDIVKQLIKADLNEVVPESYKLFCLVATLPITPTRGESCFQRLNAYLESNKTMGTFTARIPLSIAMVQMPLLCGLEKTDTWYEKIINRFADEKKSHNIEIIS